jgi:uncharacterized protein YacL
MEVNMIYITLGLIFILLITRVITVETFQMNLATLTLFIILITLLFSSLSVKYVNSNNSNYNNNNNKNSNHRNNNNLARKQIIMKPYANENSKTSFTLDLPLY